MSILLIIIGMSRMVRGNCVLNGSSGKLKVVVKKEKSLKDSRVDVSVDED